MRNLILSVFIAVFAMGASISQTDEQVSAEISAWLSRNFPNESLMDMKVDLDNQADAYEVKMTDGSEIEFDIEGHPTSIKSKKGFWPEALPEQIATYLNSNHPDVKIQKYKKEDDGQEVKLADGTELEFDSMGQILEEGN